MSDDNKEGAGVPVMWQERQKLSTARWSDWYESWSTCTVGKTAAFSLDSGGVPYEFRPLYSTPPAAMPAAPSDAQIERMTQLAFAATNDRGEMGLQKYWYGKGVRDGAALSQTMQPQALAASAKSVSDMLLEAGAIWGGIRGKWSATPAQVNAFVEILNRATSQAEPAAGEQAARNWIHGEAIDYLEVPDVQDESGINAHYSRDLVLQCIDAAIEAGKEQAGAVAIINGEPAAAHSLLDALIDIYDDAENKAPEHRCYAEDAWEECLSEARAFLAAPGAAVAAREQSSIKYVPVDSSLRDGNHNHPNDKEVRTPECTAALKARGDSEGQGLDGFWKWGFAAGFNAALASREEAPATPPAEIPAAPSNAALLVMAKKHVVLCPVTEYMAHMPRYQVFTTKTLAAFIDEARAALTQPTTVQQAEGALSARIEKLAADICAGSGPEESLALVSAFMRECAALNGMQPGERKEGA